MKLLRNDVTSDRLRDFALNAENLIFHLLFAVDASSESQVGRNSRYARSMQGFMTPLHSGKDLVPLTFDIGAVGVEVNLESCRRENTLSAITFILLL